MKLNKYSLLGLGILMSITIFGSQVVEASEVSTASSKAIFELQAGDDETIPGIIDPDIQPPTNNKGPLSLDAVSSFNFATKKLGTESKAPLEAIPVEGKKLGLQVTDSRGQDLGWNLKVSATSFQTVDKSLTLKGAVMTIPEGKLTTLEGVDPILKPSAFKVDLSETPASIMSATTTQGRSTWLNTFEEKGEKVTLAVPAGNKVASYNSTITWSLEDAP
ncbi:WxL domain-containing protein [Carnobacterium maltaromaticum]|uniref:WxL domain-containing protein n=1 Tax=Carnobacterium maltaromaticum TaxID=2751 RepID=A0AAW9K4J3_CARML|nr:WxL domain-containing protein [Carnobacterium maltaromaticum]MDZ5760710.1 WxL domain-containing protein [Carnobacterium maltaromaticum]